MIHFVVDYPPNIEEIYAVFGKENIEGKPVIFAYGDSIYNPTDSHISDDVRAHEYVHLRQHGHTREGAAAWWAKYLVDPEFRLSQESEAYQGQYEYFCRMFKDKNTRARYLTAKAEEFSSALYGNIISFKAAGRVIQKLPPKAWYEI